MALMREFLTDGRLGEVQLGLRPEEVTNLLGPADDRSVRRQPVYLLRHGAVEFAFKPVPDGSDLRLVSIAIHFSRPGRVIPPVLRPADWAPSNETTEQEFRRFLEQVGLRVHSSVSGEQEYLTLDSGGNAVFVRGTLHSIYFKRGDKKPERKQMTVSLPEQSVQTLKRRAREEGLSVHDLVERMIEAGQ